jgi:2-(1,2-epoxy-1,2-dihydrophenyl)acetyl-CoA isomerase
MHYQALLFTVENGIAKITLNRPESLNSLNEQMLVELIQVIDICASNNEVKAVMITGSGRGFCAGADLGKVNLDNNDAARAEQGRAVKAHMDRLFNPVISKLANLPKPVINAINGVAAGGGMGLSLIGDIIIAAESATFVQVFIPQLGIVPDMGSTWLLPRLIGRSRAMGLALLGDKVTAQQALDLGLIWQVYADDQLLAEAEKLAQRLAAGPTFGIGKLKEIMRASEHNSLDQQLALEADTQLECCASEDFLEGVIAFATKRKPNFKGC